jgi:hypothetical protein
LALVGRIVSACQYDVAQQFGLLSIPCSQHPASSCAASSLCKGKLSLGSAQTKTRFLEEVAYGVRLGYQLREPLGDGALLVVHMDETMVLHTGLRLECIPFRATDSSLALQHCQSQERHGTID